MKNSANKITFEYIISIFLIINIFYLFFGMVLIFYNFLTYNYFSKGLIVLLCLSLALIIISFFCKYKKDKLDILLLFLTILGIIATIFAYNIEVSIFGVSGRYEGLLQLVFYYSLLYLGSFVNNKKYIKNIVIVILTFGVFEAVYGFLQIIDIPSFLDIRGSKFILHEIVYARGFVTNPNFFSSYIVLCVALSIGMYLKEEKKSIIYLLLTILFFGTLCVANTSSGVIGYICIMIIVILYIFNGYIKKDKKRHTILQKTIVLIIFSTLFLEILTYTNKTYLVRDLKEIIFDVKISAETGQLNDDMGTKRIYIWRNTLAEVPENIVNGVGIDNFIYAFDGDRLYNKAHNVFHDKAHNEYLQKLITEGIFSILAYLSILLIIFLNGIKKVFKDGNIICMSLLLAFVGYVTQAFFNISVIEVAPLFYLIAGLLYSRNKGVQYE